MREGYDLTRAKFNAAIASFVASIEPGDTAVFVYSGHGWSDGTQNYLIGVDAPRQASEDELAGETIPIRNGVDGVLDRIERKGAALRVAIIDACRDNPFTPSPGHKGYLQTRGFAPMTQPPQGTFVIFSASPGQSALDRLSEGDPDSNGVFTRVFVPLLRADVSLQDAVKGAQEKVLELARSVDHDQLPAYWDEVVGTACLSKACKPIGASGASHENLASVSDSTTSAKPSPPPVAPPPDPCAASEDSAIVQPVVNVFESMRKLDIDLYAAQWADDAVYRNGKTGQIKSKAQIVAAKVAQFARWRQVQVSLNGPFVVRRSADQALIEDSYAFTIDSGGRILKDNANERYTVRCLPGGRWIISQNLDYAQ